MITTTAKKLYLSPELADVHFVLESDDGSERIPAHKLLLMAASDVFAKMFNGSWKEKDEVIITETPVNAFKQFLQFFYNDKVKLTMEHIAAVMNLGEMYNVAECLAVCTKFVKNNLNDDNVCRYYELAILYNQQELMQSCEMVIGVNTNAVFKSPGFLACDQKVLAEILKLNWLLCTEVELFEACMAWVKTKGETNELTKDLVRAQLGDSFHHIRFGLMSMDGFVELIPEYGQVFTAAEYSDIIQIIANEEYKAKTFSENRWKREWNECRDDYYLIGCYRRFIFENSVKPYFIKNVETTTFSVDEPILLKYIDFCDIFEYRDGKYIHCADVDTNITIVEVYEADGAKKESVKYEGKTKLSSSRYGGVWVRLGEGLLIRPGFMYEIRLQQNPPKNCATGAILQSEVEMHDGVTVHFYDDPMENFPARGTIQVLRLHEIGKLIMETAVEDSGEDEEY